MDLESIELRSLVVVVRRHVSVQVSSICEGELREVEGKVGDSSIESLKKDGSPSNGAIARHSLVLR